MTGAHNRPPTSGSAARPNPRVPRRRSYVIWDKRNEEDLKLITPLLIFPPKTSLRAKCKMYVHPPRVGREVIELPGGAFRCPIGLITPHFGNYDAKF